MSPKETFMQFNSRLKHLIIFFINDLATIFQTGHGILRPFITGGTTLVWSGFFPFHHFLGPSP